MTNGISVNTAIFYNDYTDFQAHDTAERALLNIDEATTSGIEMEAIEYVGSTELRQSVGYITSKVDKDSVFENGNDLPNAPSWNLSAGATHYLSSSLSIAGDVVHVGEYFSDLDNTENEKAGDYITVSANVAWQFRDFTMAAYGKNLTNEDIVYWNNDGNRVAIGQSRPLGISLT